MEEGGGEAIVGVGSIFVLGYSSTGVYPALILLNFQ